MASRNSNKNELNSTRDGSRNSGRKYRGVQRVPSGRWSAKIERKGLKRICIGTYDSDVEAALSYDRMARILHGAKATLNFPYNRHDDNVTLPKETSPVRGLASGSAFAYILGEQPVLEVGSVVRTTGNQIGSSGSTTGTLDETPVAAEVRLPIEISDSTLLNANPSASGVQVSVPLGSSSANTGKGEKRKQITISKSEFDAFLPYHEARKREFAQRRQNVAQLRTTSTLPIATSSVRGVAIGSESANISSVQPAVMESFGNPGDLKDVPLEELLSDADKEFVESLLNQGKASNEDKPS